MEEKPSIFYGCIYDSEKGKYKSVIRDQFKNCSEKAKRDGMDIKAWGFDVMIENSIIRNLAKEFVEKCSEEYLPGVENVSAIKNL